MRMAPNSRKWLEKGKCLSCGKYYDEHRSGEQYREHWERYANSYYTTLSANQQETVDKWATKTEEKRQDMKRRIEEAKPTAYGGIKGKIFGDLEGTYTAWDLRQTLMRWDLLEWYEETKK